MANTKIIGKVAVKIYPDTSDFRREAERALAADEKRLRADVPLHADDSDFLSEARRAVREAQDLLGDLEVGIDIDKPLEHLRDTLNDLHAKLHLDVDKDELHNALRDATEHVKIDPELDKDRFQRDLDDIANAAEKRFNDFADNSIVGEMFDPKDVDKQIRDVMDEAQQAIDNARDLQLEIEIEGMTEAERDIDRLKLKLADLEAKATIEFDEDKKRLLYHDIADIKDKLNDATKKRQAEIDADLNDKLGVARKLAILARDRVVTLIPSVSKAAAAKAAATLKSLSGTTGVQNALSDVNEMLENIINNAPKFAVIGTSIAGFVTQIAGAAVNMFSLGDSLAKIGGLGLALPGIFGGIGVSMITLATAFAGLKQAMPDVYKQFSKIKDVIQGNFWKEAGSALRGLAPVLEKSFGGLATSLGKVTGAIANGLIPDLPEMFANTSKAADILAANSKPIAGIFATLGKTGSQYLPVLATWIGKIATQFDGFLTKAGKDGRLKGWIDDGIAALKDLWGIAQDTYGIINGISDAAKKAGGITLSGFRKDLDGINKAVNSASFQKNLTGFFKAILDGTHDINKIAGGAWSKVFRNILVDSKRVLPQVAKAYGNLIGGIADALNSPGFRKGIRDLTTGVANGMEKLRPHMKDIGDGFGVILSVVGKLAENTLPLLGDILGTIGKGLSDNKKPILDFVSALGDFAKKLWEDGLKDAVTQFMANLPDLLTFFEDLLSDIKPVIKPMGDFLEALVQLGDWFAKNPTQMELGKQIFKDLGSVLKVLADILNPSSGNLSKLFGDLWSVIQKMSPFVQSLSASFKAVGDIFSKIAGTDVGGSFTILLDGLKKIGDFNVGNIGKTIATGLANGIAAAAPSVIKAASAVRDAAKSIWQNYNPIAVGKRIGSDLASGIRSLLRANADAARTLRDAAKNVWAQYSPVAVGKRIGNDLASGIKSVAGANADAARTLRDIAKNIWTQYSPRSVGSRIGNDLAAGIRSVITAVANAARTLRDAISNIWRAFDPTGIGSRIAGLFRNGVVSRRSDATSAGLSLSNAVRSGAGSANLYSAGVSVINSFISGIRSMFYSVQSTLSSLTSMIPDWKGPEATDKVLLYDAGQLVIKGFVNGLESQYDTVHKSLKGLTNDMQDTFSAGLTSNIKVSRPSSSYYAGPVGSPGADQAGPTPRVVIHQTNINPVAENTSVAANKAAQMAGAFGFA